jgi:hypothetical protein
VREVEVIEHLVEGEPAARRVGDLRPVARGRIPGPARFLAPLAKRKRERCRV